MLNFINRLLNKPRELSPNEILELQELHRIASSYKFIANQIKGNTALIEDGKKLARQMEQIATLAENVKGQWISQKLAHLGYEKDQRVNVNLLTGEIIKAKIINPINPKNEPTTG